MRNEWIYRRGPDQKQRLVVALLSAGAVLSPSVYAAKTPGTHTVIIQAVSFEPTTLTVNRGEIVVWVNKDPFPHTVTAPGTFDSHSIAAGHSWRYVARKAGKFDYICTLHPNMKGTLRVE